MRAGGRASGLGRRLGGTGGKGPCADPGFNTHTRPSIMVFFYYGSPPSPATGPVPSQPRREGGGRSGGCSSGIVHHIWPPRVSGHDGRARRATTALLIGAWVARPSRNAVVGPRRRVSAGGWQRSHRWNDADDADKGDREGSEVHRLQAAESQDEGVALIGGGAETD